MLRKLIITTIVVNFVFMLAGVLTTFDRSNMGIALANNTASFGTGATVPQFLEINAILRTVEWNATTGIYDINWQSSPNSLNYGTLVQVNYTNGQFAYMAGDMAYAIIMYPITSGMPYDVKQSGTILSDGQGHTIPNAAYVMTPDYQGQDTIGGQQQGNMPNGASLAAPQSAVGNNHLVYTSDNDGTSKAVRAFLGIVGPDVNGNIRNYAQGYDINGNPQGAAQYYQGNGQNNWTPVTQNQPAGQYSGSVTVTVNLI
jgi:hypothetical protein